MGQRRRRAATGPGRRLRQSAFGAARAGPRRCARAGRARPPGDSRAGHGSDRCVARASTRSASSGLSASSGPCSRVPRTEPGERRPRTCHRRPPRCGCPRRPRGVKSARASSSRTVRRSLASQPMRAGRSSEASGRVTTVPVTSGAEWTVTGRETESLVTRTGRVDPRSRDRVETGVDGEEHRAVCDPRREVGRGQRLDECGHAAASRAADEVDVGADEGVGPVDGDGLDGEVTRGATTHEGTRVGLVGRGDGGEREERGHGECPAQWVPPRNCLEMRRKAG